MKNKYLFVVDLDGTLLTDKKTIPLATRRYIKKISKQGHHVVIASGRPIYNIRPYYKSLKLKTPIISFNGNHVYFADDKVKNKSYYLDNKILNNIVKEISKLYPIINIVGEANEDMYIMDKNVPILKPKFWLKNVKPIYMSLEKMLKENIMTFVIQIKGDFNYKKIENIITKYPNYHSLRWPGLLNCYIQIYCNIKNKYSALEDVANYYNIEKENIVVFGDDYNDLEMLTKIPNAFAMKNAVEDVKKKVKNITRYDNKHQGVKKQIKAILKKTK